MAILVGIDEAGYGPLLGPLVVSAATLDLPETLLRADLWAVLSKAVSAHKKTLAGRLLITDSKKAYNRKSGPGHLRRTVLSCLHSISSNRFPAASDLISALCPESAEQLNRYPWYQSLPQQPLGHCTEDIAIAAATLNKALTENQMKFHGITSRCLDVESYNHRVRSVRNKSRVLFTELCSLILNISKLHGRCNEPIHVIVDRQGGRINYQQELMRMFPDWGLSTIKQDAALSSYQLDSNRKSMRIHFCMKADTKHLCVSLASMASKYLREVIMESLNTYFCSRCEGLTPTAGYWQDGQRFIKDLSIQLPSHPHIPEKLVRIS